MIDTSFSWTGSAQEVFERWWERLPDALPMAGLLATLALVLFVSLELLRRRGGGEFPVYLRKGWLLAVLVLALLAGYRLVFEAASLFDDAFISFRFARNFAEGHGLVWNVGERVEGYSNFLWTFVIGLLTWSTPWDPPEIGLALSLVCFGLNLAVVALLVRELARGWLAPGLSVAMLAVSRVYVDYGSSGLETGLGSLLVALGALFLVRKGSAKNSALAGSTLILATLTRQDHSLFYVAGGVGLSIDRWLEVRRATAAGRPPPWKQAVRRVLAYSTPFLPYLLYLGWKLSYYGDILPNTYYARSAYLTWWTQGWIYASTFYLSSGVWLGALLGLGWLVLRSRSAGERRFKLFFIGSFVLFNVYVMKLGGDFMYGRFYVSLLPLVLLSGEMLGLELWRRAGEAGRRPLAGLLALALLASTALEVPVLGRRDNIHGIVDEAARYRLSELWPPVVRHRAFWTGMAFGRFLADRDIPAILGCAGIGQIGYYSRLELVDFRGLTDPVIARTELNKRGWPGHEKSPPAGYVAQRGVQLVRVGWDDHPERFRKLTRFELTYEGRETQEFAFAYWDAELMRRIASEVPEMTYLDFPAMLDSYIRTLDRRNPAQVAEDLRWFRRYYFDHNEDEKRLRSIHAWLEPAAGSGCSPDGVAQRDQDRAGRRGERLHRRSLDEKSVTARSPTETFIRVEHRGDVEV